MKRPAAKNKKQRQRRRVKPQPEPMGIFSLVEHRTDGRKSVEFQQMKGKILETITLNTTPEYHSIDDASFAMHYQGVLPRTKKA